MRFPTVHLNGTAGDELLAQLEKAKRAVWTARCALADAHPNARDYYPQGNDAYLEVADEHSKRTEKLSEVERELRDMAEAVAEQLAERKRR